MQGELTLAREHLQRVVALYEQHRHRTLVVRCAYDPGVYAHVMEAWVLWVLGYPAQGLRRSHEALHLARASAPLYPRAYPGHERHSTAHGGRTTFEHVQASLALTTEYGFPYLTALGTVLQGWS